MTRHAATRQHNRSDAAPAREHEATSTMPRDDDDDAARTPPVTPPPPPPVRDLIAPARAGGSTVPLASANEVPRGGSVLSPVDRAHAVLFGKGSIAHGRGAGWITRPWWG